MSRFNKTLNCKAIEIERYLSFAPPSIQLMFACLFSGVFASLSPETWWKSPLIILKGSLQEHSLLQYLPKYLPWRDNSVRPINAYYPFKITPLLKALHFFPFKSLFSILNLQIENL